MVNPRLCAPDNTETWNVRSCRNVALATYDLIGATLPENISKRVAEGN